MNVKQLHNVSALPHNAAPLWTFALKALEDRQRRWETQRINKLGIRPL